MPTLVPLYSGAMFVSALLLFGVQPMFTKMALPLLGGSPAVWITAQVFFQATLLAGYLYAHLIAKLLLTRSQVIVHLLLLSTVFIVVPIQIDEAWAPPVLQSPIPWFLGLLSLSVGLPFFAVSTTAPLLQRWFAESGHGAAADPYFLYAASNLGGLLALIAYPFLLEPRVGLEQQSFAWVLGYAVLVALIGFAALHLWRRAATGAGERSSSLDRSGDNLLWRQRTHWVLLAFVPSSLLLGVTLHISTDIAASPILWVTPLSLYLLSFVLVFARRPMIKHRWMIAAQPVLLIGLTLFFSSGRLLVDVLLHLGAFFVTAMVCHGSLAALRPRVQYLTEFFLCISVGGVLGGVFAGLVAPLMFDAVLEYPLALVLACALRPVLDRSEARAGLRDIALPLGLGVFYLLVGLKSPLGGVQLSETGELFLLAALGLILFTFRLRPVRLALGVLVLLLPSHVLPAGHLLTQQRSYFGVHRVFVDASGEYQLLTHGTTIHGAEHRHASRWREPLTYYYAGGPLGQFFDHYRVEKDFRHIGAIGLGAGSIACYRSSPEVPLTFFEIDPVVVGIATNPSLFRFLEQCGGGVEVILGDGRRGLQGTPDGQFGLLVLDAFSSDAVPTHLLTREAMALYFRKLSEDGILLIHISNKHLDLETVVAALVTDAGLTARVQHHQPGAGSEQYHWKSSWVVISRAPARLARLSGDPRWHSLRSAAGSRPWSDDYSFVIGALDWRRLFDR